MITKSVPQKILTGTLHTEEIVTLSQENARKNTLQWPSRLIKKKKKKRTGNSTDFSVLARNVNGLNAPIKRHRKAS
jgi:hypothetical protein